MSRYAHKLNRFAQGTGKRDRTASGRNARLSGESAFNSVTAKREDMHDAEQNATLHFWRYLCKHGEAVSLDLANVPLASREMSALLRKYGSHEKANAAIRLKAEQWRQQSGEFVETTAKQRPKQNPPRHQAASHQTQTNEARKIAKLLDAEVRGATAAAREAYFSQPQKPTLRKKSPK